MMPQWTSPILFHRHPISIGLSAAIVLVGCGAFGDPPPVEFSVRESLLGAGIILQIENTSNEPLEGLELKITAPSGEERHFKAERLDAYGTLEVGWKKLGGWEIPPESQVTLGCDGYVVRAVTKLPAASP